MKYFARIIVKLKNGVKDVQGVALNDVLKNMEYEKNPSSSVGKFFELKIEASDLETAKEKINKIAFEVLSNPLIETYEILEILEVKE